VTHTELGEVLRAYHVTQLRMAHREGRYVATAVCKGRALTGSHTDLQIALDHVLLTLALNAHHGVDA